MLCIPENLFDIFLQLEPEELAAIIRALISGDKELQDKRPDDLSDELNWRLLCVVYDLIVPQINGEQPKLQ